MPGSEAEGTLLALHHHPDSERETGELGPWGGGDNPWLLPLPKPLHPQLFPPLQAAGPGREQGWSWGRKPVQGQQETQEAVWRVGSRGLDYCSIFFWKEKGGKTEDRSPPPRPSGNPPQASGGIMWGSLYALSPPILLLDDRVLNWEGCRGPYMPWAHPFCS